MNGNSSKYVNGERVLGVTQKSKEEKDEFKVSVSNFSKTIVTEIKDTGREVGKSVQPVLG